MLIRVVIHSLIQKIQRGAETGSSSTIFQKYTRFVYYIGSGVAGYSKQITVRVEHELLVAIVTNGEPLELYNKRRQRTPI